MDAQDVRIYAEASLQTVGSVLQDIGASFLQLGGKVEDYLFKTVDTVLETTDDLGKGLKTGLEALPWALPIAVLVLLVYFFGGKKQ